MPSFDIVCEANLVEVKNAVEQANKEVANRFDFKGRTRASSRRSASSRSSPTTTSSWAR